MAMSNNERQRRYVKSLKAKASIADDFEAAMNGLMASGFGNWPEEIREVAMRPVLQLLERMQELQERDVFTDHEHSRAA